MVKWYHEVLGHPGESRTKLTINSILLEKNCAKRYNKLFLVCASQMAEEDCFVWLFWCSRSFVSGISGIIDR